MRRRTMVGVLGLAAWLCGALVTGSHAAEEQFGKVHFPISCSPEAQAQFDRALALLHSFFFSEAVKAFTAVTQTQPGCAMGYWGLAMSIRQNPLYPTNIATLKRAAEALEKAKAASAPTPRERDWIAALDTYYRDFDTVDRKTRVLAYEKAKDAYWAEQVEIQRRAAAAWLARAEGRHTEAVGAMRSAADLEDASEKHVAMENRLVPMRELLGEPLLEVNEPAAALVEFEASLQPVPNRFCSFFGAARAAELAGDREKARAFYAKLVALADKADTDRPELASARTFLAK